MIEEDMNEVKNRLFSIEAKLDKLIPVIKDVSKHLAEAKQIANKGKPPRKQPKKKEQHQDDDHCDCGGILNYTERDKENVMIFKCEDCGKEHYNERDL